MSNKILLGAIIGAVLNGAHVANAAAALEEVIVSAQKQDETVQNVPISMEVLDAKVLANSRIESVGDLRTLVPSLQTTPLPTASQNMGFVIRGIRTGAPDLTQDGPVAVYLNGVYLARPNGLNFDLGELERVEVLRGPQGTLYGRNATGGAISLVTAKPEQKFYVKQQLSAGNYSLFQSKTTVNVPLTDTLAAKLNYNYNTKDGFIKNAGEGKGFGDRRAQSARFDVRWTPSDDLVVDYGYDWNNMRYVTAPSQCLVGTPTVLSPTFVNRTTCDMKYRSSLTPGYAIDWSNTISYGHTLNVEWDAGPVTVKSITGYRHLYDRYEGSLAADGNGFRLDVGPTNSKTLNLPAGWDTLTHQRQFSEELQVFGDITDTLNYVTGLYYFEEKGDASRPREHVASYQIVPGMVSMINLSTVDAKAKNTSWAVFAQATWTPDFAARRLEIVPGLRFTKDKREASLYTLSETYIVNEVAQSITPTGAFTPITGEPSKTYSQLTPGLTLQYHWTDNVMTYAKAVKGYKSGGYSLRAPTASDFNNGFGPETLVSYEAGIKTDLFDHRLRVNADYFRYRYSDQQVTVFAGLLGGRPAYNVVNAGESTLQGAELEVTAAITEALRARVAYAYLDARYDSVKDQFGNDATAQYYYGVPQNSYTVALDYAFPRFSFGQLDFNLTYSHIDSVGVAAAASQPRSNLRRGIEGGQVTPAYGTLDGRLSLSEIGVGSNGSLQVALWSKNLENKRYLSLVQNPVPGQASSGMWGEPRTFGLDVVYRYE